MNDDGPKKVVEEDVYAGFDPEARAYFEQLDYALPPSTPEPLPNASLRRPGLFTRLVRLFKRNH